MSADTPVVEYRNPAGEISPTGPWSVLSRVGDRALFIAGMRGIDPATDMMVPDEEDRALAAFRNVRSIAEGEGFPLGTCVRLVVYVTDMTRFRPLVNAAQEAVWGGPFPPRTIVEVAALNQADVVEVEATFMRA